MMSCTLLNVNCFDGFKDIPDGSIDLVITDPPYNRNQGYDNDNMPRDGFLAFTRKWIIECKRVLSSKGAIYCFINGHMLFDLHGILREFFEFRSLLVWSFEGFYRDFTGNYENKCEYILFFANPRHEINPVRVKSSKSTMTRWGPYSVKEGEVVLKSDGRKYDFGDVPYERLTPASRKRYKQKNYENSPVNVYRGPYAGNVFAISRCRNKIHVSQKPEEIISVLVKVSSSEDDAVLDPFSGSGTTAIVAWKLGRNGTGFEISKEFHEKAMLRLNHEEQLARIK